MVEPAILAYHEATKHSPASVRSGGRGMDWANRPSAFKEYLGDLPAVALPLPPVGLAMPALVAAGAPAPAPGEERELDLDALARILGYGAGVLRKLAVPGGPTLYFRTYACAGGLYPVEVYLVTGGLEEVPAGVYHYQPLPRRLVRLRDRDWRPSLGVGADALVLTGMPWRTAWKYGDRGFRHLYWDAGMILANVLALASACGIDAHLEHGFADGEVSALLGLDGHTEVPLCVVPLGPGRFRGGGVAAPAPPPALDLPRKPLSRNEIEDPAILAAQAAGVLADGAAVAAWREEAQSVGGGPSAVRAEAVRAGGPAVRLEAVIRRRGSARQFDRTPMALGALESTLACTSGGVRSDVSTSGSRIVTPYLIANRIEGLAPGAYRYVDGLELLGEGDFAQAAAYLCLEQGLAGDAAATLFLMADLGGLVGAAGDRMYRVAQLEAGVLGGRVYLGAHASGASASGLTFYDDLVTEFFAPAATGGLDCMLVTAVGPATRRLLPLA